tara:strand:- start:7999 stop:8424 length:426 start_codon:yes stop_codon:yes gene_type:complete
MTSSANDAIGTALIKSKNKAIGLSIDIVELILFKISGGGIIIPISLSISSEIKTIPNEIKKELIKLLFEIGLSRTVFKIEIFELYNNKNKGITNRVSPISKAKGNKVFSVESDKRRIIEVIKPEKRREDITTVNAPLGVYI